MALQHAVITQSLFTKKSMQRFLHKWKCEIFPMGMKMWNLSMWGRQGSARLEDSQMMVCYSWGYLQITHIKLVKSHLKTKRWCLSVHGTLCVLFSADILAKGWRKHPMGISGQVLHKTLQKKMHITWLQDIRIQTKVCAICYYSPSVLVTFLRNIFRQKALLILFLRLHASPC